MMRVGFVLGVIGVGAAGLGATACSSAASAIDSSDDAVVGEPSYVGKAVLAKLEATHPKTKGRAWNVSRDNSFSGDFTDQIPTKQSWGQKDLSVGTLCKEGDAGCDPDFLLTTCTSDADCTGRAHCTTLKATVAHRGDSPRSLCAGDADAILDTVWSGIALARHTVDVSSLTPPNGRFEAAVRNAVTYVSESESPPRVRMLFGDYPGAFTSATKTLASLARDVAPASGLVMSVGTYRAGVTSWNHSKIISRDGEYAVMGGANMWDSHYLRKNPVHDIWITENGSAAADAARYLDELWVYTCGSSNLVNMKDVASRGIEGCQKPFAAEQAAVAHGTGNVPVISVGRLGSLGEEPSDDAILAMIDSAKTSIRMTQQDLGPVRRAGVPLGTWPEATIQALVRAMARGVKVSLVLSNTGAVPGDMNAIEATFNTYDNGWTPVDVLREFEKIARTQVKVANASALLCDSFTLMRLRSSDGETWQDGGTLANHAKVVVVDDRAFYLGSQNLYVANLAEFGAIVDDPKATKLFLANYMDIVEQYSKRTAVSGSGGGSCSLNL